MKQGGMKVLKLLIGWPLSFFALYFVFTRFSPESATLGQIFARVNWISLIFSLLSFFFFYFLRVFLWKKMLYFWGHPVSYTDLAPIWVTSEIQRYIPGNIWSVVSRAIQLERKNVPKKTITMAFLFEAILLGFVCFLLSIPAIYLILDTFFPFIQRRDAIASVLIIVIVVAILIFVFSFPKKIFRKIQTFFPILPWKENIQLLFITVAMFVFYGLGTYLSVASFTYISVFYLSTFIGLFCFSLIVGYLSFITPSGLGVREGIMTLGLLRMGVAVGAIASIFSRVILILSEVLFFLFTITFSRTKAAKRLEDFIERNMHLAIVTLGVFIYTTYFTVTSFLRFENFYTGRFDLGNMDQTVWNSLRGNLFMFTNPDGTNIMSRLGFHADFILVLFAPLYALWSDPRMLLFLQAIVVGLGAFAVFGIAKHITKSPLFSTVLAFSYLLNPSLSYSILYDFHPVVLASSFLLFAWYFLLKGKLLLFLLFALLSGLTKEQVWIVVGLLSFYAFLKTKEKKLFAVVTVFSFGIFYYLVWVAIPSIRSDHHFALAFFEEFGSSPSEVAQALFFDPGKTMTSILSESGFEYAKRLLLPLGFLSLFSPFQLLFSLPDFAINFLGSNPNFRTIYYQYTAVITPFLFISSVYGALSIRKLFPKVNYSFLSSLIIFFTLYSAYIYGPLPASSKPNIDMYTKQLPYKDFVWDTLKKIPEEASVSATNNLGAHLSHRKYLFTIPVGTYEADYVAFLLNDMFAQPSLETQKQMARELKLNQRYQVIAEQGDFILFKLLASTVRSYLSEP